MFTTDDLTAMFTVPLFETVLIDPLKSEHLNNLTFQSLPQSTTRLYYKY